MSFLSSLYLHLCELRLYSPILFVAFAVFWEDLQYLVLFLFVP